MDGNQEALGTRLRCFGREVENGGTFHTFCEEEIAQLPLKNCKNSNIKNTTRRMPSAIWRISAEQSIPLYHERAGKQANGGNHLFAFFTINYFECLGIALNYKEPSNVVKIPVNSLQSSRAWI